MPDHPGDFERISNDIQSFSSLGIRPGLERMARLLSRLGSPEKKFPAIQVLGTNGKGSTAATIESICRASGLRTALYTSPHLTSLRERLRVGGKYLGIEVWRGAFRRLVGAVESDSVLCEVRPTFFESLTTVCFLMISESDIDVAVIEAGMGGRYDATSSCEPAATVVTPIGMDHMEYLGDTLQAIASEKFAAVRGGVPAFYSADDETLTLQFEETCKSAGAPSFPVSRMALTENILCTLEGTSFDYVSSPAVLRKLRTPLVGVHQAYNASNAISVLLTLGKTSPVFGRIGEREIRDGLSSVLWPGRMEVMRPGRDLPIVLLDGAHNEHGFRALVSSIRALIAGGCVKGLGALVFAVMKDKDITEILEMLKELGAPIFCTQPEMARAMPAGDLLPVLRAAGCDARDAFDESRFALAAAMAASSPDELVVCCGSLFLVGAMRDLFADNVNFAEILRHKSSVLRDNPFKDAGDR
jgi:dihydrofolate synthase/folylpolyglutamate synthase